MSELYASLLMIGVTLALGGAVASSALSQFSMADSSSSLGAADQVAAAQTQVSLVYLVAASSGSCPAYDGYHEGTSVTIAVYNYGGAPFSPAAIALNGTIYFGSYAQLGPGTLGTYTVVSATCVHSSGQTVVIEDSSGDEVQFAT